MTHFREDYIRKDEKTGSKGNYASSFLKGEDEYAGKAIELLQMRKILNSGI